MLATLAARFCSNYWSCVCK